MKYVLMQIRAKIYLALGLVVCSAMMASAVQVTFQVNMSAQTALGNFDPITGSVVVAGDPLNGWSLSASPLASSATESNIWEGTFDVPGAAGSTVQYKYVMNGGTWEGQVGPGGGTGNRTFTLAATDQTLPVVYFNNVTNSTSVTNAITFQVNMSVQIALGNFDPAADTVSIAGEFNNWNTSASMLTNSVSDTNLWVTTLTLSGAVDSAVNYKYVVNGGNWEANNVGTGGTQNRSVTLARTNQTLPVVYFNNVKDLGPLSIHLLSGGQAAFSWTAGPLIRLQTAGTLPNGTWEDVPNTQGSDSVTLPLASGAKFFRLTAP